MCVHETIDCLHVEDGMAEIEQVPDVYTYTYMYIYMDIHTMQINTHLGHKRRSRFARRTGSSSAAPAGAAGAAALRCHKRSAATPATNPNPAH